MTNEYRSNAPRSVLRLMRALVHGTDSGHVEWRQLGSFEYRFDAPSGFVTISTTAAEEDPFIFAIFGENESVPLEAYQAPTRFSDATLDENISQVWQSIIRQRRSRTIDPVVESLIVAAGGDAPEPPEPPFDDSSLDDLPF